MKKLDSLEIGHGSNFCLIISTHYSHIVGLNLGNYVLSFWIALYPSWNDCLPQPTFEPNSCVSPGLTTMKMWIVVARKFPGKEKWFYKTAGTYSGHPRALPGLEP